MNTTQAGPHTGRPGDTPLPVPAPASGDPRIGWSAPAPHHAPRLRHRRDGILPTVAAALSVHGTTLTGTA
ncbi:MAG TPA: hypothetical protein VFP69_00395, partial [Streptomyces sp.]|nr:hypothetical protein [Streptomyces sp.]